MIYFQVNVLFCNISHVKKILRRQNQFIPRRVKNILSKIINSSQLKDNIFLKYYYNRIIFIRYRTKKI